MMNIGARSGHSSLLHDRPTDEALRVPGWRRVLSARTVRWLALALIALGIAYRLLWVMQGDRLEPHVAESQRVAVALVTQGEFADAFTPDSGPTAHLGPLSPVIPAIVYAVFGVETPAAEFMLSLIAILTVAAGFWIAYLIFGELGVPVIGRLAALAIVSLVPLWTGLEVAEFRAWEAGQATVLLALVILWCLRLDRRQERPGLRTLFAISAVIAFMAVLNPPSALGAAGVFSVLLLRRYSWWYVPIAGAVTLALFLAMSTPWMLRNKAVFGAAIWTRSSAPLSLAVSNHDGAVDPADPHKAYKDRMRDIHPTSPAGLAAMQAAGGEVAYAQKLSRETYAWMKAHPWEVLTMRVRNAFEYYFPPEWLWKRFGPGGPATRERQWIVSVLSMAAFVTLALMLAHRRGRYLYVTAAVLLPVLPYAMGFPTLRYRYLVSSLLIFLALDGLSRLFEHLRSRGKLGFLA